MLTHIVAALGHTPVFHTARLAPQAADALAAEHAERGRNPVARRRHYRPRLNPYTPFVLRDFCLVAWLFTNRVRDVRHVRTGGGVWRGEW